MRILPFDHLRIVQIDLHKVLLLGVVTIERPARQRSPKCLHLRVKVQFDRSRLGALTCQKPAPP